MKRWMVWISLVFLFLTGCGGMSEETQMQVPAQEAAQQEQSLQNAQALRHLSGEIASLPEEGTITALAAVGDRVYWAAWSKAAPCWRGWTGREAAAH